MTLEEIKQQLGEDTKVFEFKLGARYLILYNLNEVDHKVIKEVGKKMYEVWGVDCMIASCLDPANALRVLEIK